LPVSIRTRPFAPSDATLGSLAAMDRTIGATAPPSMSSSRHPASVRAITVIAV
jgi:hypothetical protein